MNQKSNDFINFYKSIRAIIEVEIEVQVDLTTCLILYERPANSDWSIQVPALRLFEKCTIDPIAYL